ncbi:hypothetical protein CKO27_08955 [Thiocystis violacea]|nr:hypothetical protein [Thiocystis violacea]
MSLMTATRTSGQSDEVRDRHIRRPDSPPQSVPESADTLDLGAAIAIALENDLDYQILRKTFALDSEEVQVGGQASGSSARLDASQGFVSDALDLQPDPAVMAAGTSDLQVSWTQVSASRLEFSARGTDASIAFTGFQGQTLEMSRGAAPVQVGDPLVLDLGGGGIATTGIEAGVIFDLNGDGRSERMSTVSGDSWFLALDWNDNGRIDDGRELFGDQNGAAHGFAELARHDSNGDNRIDEGDEVFARLRLVQVGAEGSQVSQSLAEANVTAIELGHQNVRKALDLYDQVAQSGRFTRADGTQGEAADVLLAYRDLA